MQAAPGFDVVVVQVAFGPGAETDWHYHPGQEITYVIDGTLVVDRRGASAVVLNAGESRSAPRLEIHRARNPSRDKTTVVIAVALAPVGQPASIPAP